MAERPNQRGKRPRVGDERKNVLQRGADAAMTGFERLGQSYGAPQSVQMDRLASLANADPNDPATRDALRRHRNFSGIDFDAPARDVRSRRGETVDPAPRGEIRQKIGQIPAELATVPPQVAAIPGAIAASFSTVSDRERAMATVPRGTPDTATAQSPTQPTQTAQIAPPTQLADTARNIIDLERRREILARERGIADPEVRQLTESIVALRREMPRERGIPLTREGMDELVASGRQVSDSLIEQDRLTPAGPSPLERERAFGARFRDEAEARRLGVDPMELDRMSSLRGGASHRFAEIDAGRVRAQQDMATEGQISDSQRLAVSETGELPPRPTVPDFRAMREREIQEQLQAAQAREMSGLEGMARAQEMRDDPGGALAAANVAARDATRAATQQVQSQIAREQLERDAEERQFMTQMQNAQREAAIRAMGPQDEFGGMTAEGGLAPSPESIAGMREMERTNVALQRWKGGPDLGMQAIRDVAKSFNDMATVPRLVFDETGRRRTIEGELSAILRLPPEDAAMIAREILRTVTGEARSRLEGDRSGRWDQVVPFYRELQRIAGQAG